MTSWMDTALGEMVIGINEVKGPEHNDRIISYHKHTTLGATEDEISWCSAFLCYVFEKNYIKSTKSAAARSWMKWGKPLDKPVLGCVVVFWRDNPDSWKGHVGLYCSEENGKIKVLGGNQSDKVCIKSYSKDKVLGYRWPDV